MKSQEGRGLCSKTSKVWGVLLRKLSEINRKIYTQDVHCSIIYKSERLETATVTRGWLDKL